MESKRENSFCFVLMPFTVHEDDEYPLGHWDEVYHSFIAKAINAAGMMSERADTEEISKNIIYEIFGKIEKSSLVVCDLSNSNPNVLFELGWAYRANVPVVLVKDDLTDYIFDLGGQSILTYSNTLRPLELERSIQKLRTTIINTINDEQEKWSILKYISNIRKLHMKADSVENIIERAILEIKNDIKDIKYGHYKQFLETYKNEADKASTSPEEKPPISLREARDHFEKAFITETIEKCGWNISMAAERLGLDRSVFYRKVQKLEIKIKGARTIN